MALSAVRVVSFSNSRRIICSYRQPLTLQLRYFRDRLTPTSISNCRLVPLGQRKFSHSRERLTSCYSFVRWNSSSSASSGVQSTEVGYSSCRILLSSDCSKSSTVGRTPVFGRRTDPVLRSACSRRVTTMWVNRPLQISQLGQLSLSSFWGY